MTHGNTIARDEWENTHQAFEIKFHSADNYRWHDDQFLPEWQENFGTFVGLSPDAFEQGETILDIGCGSRPALNSYFTSGTIVNLEPLADSYWNIPQVRKYWSEEIKRNTIKAPAEEWQRKLVGACALVLCWNVLDHCYDWRNVLTNALSYVAVGGMFVLVTDLEPHGEGHPGVDCPADMVNSIVRSCRFLKLQINHGQTVKRDIAIVATRL